jgi:predicted dehydrogenase
MERKKVGIIGLGKITQLKHLYYLFHSEEFKIEAICDISQSLLKSVGEVFGVEKRFEDYKDMFNLELDVVMVLTHDHAFPIIDALNAGFDVFTEKPLCWTEEEAELIKKTVERTGNKLVIGYMKRFIPNYNELKHKISKLPNKKIINVKTFASGTKVRIPPSHTVFKDSNIKPFEKNVGSKVSSRIMSNNSYSEQQAADYRMLMELGIHNLNFLIDILGEPISIDYAKMWSSRTNGNSENNNVKTHRMFLAILTFPEDLKCVWEIGTFFDGKLEWKDTITINDFQEEISINFPNPFVRGLPINIETTKIINGYPHHLSEFSFYEDSFKLELTHLYNCLSEKEYSRTPVEEGLRDIKWIRELTDCITY